MKKIIVGNKLVGEGYPCFIIAEAGSNHNGDLGIAKRMIRAAKAMGADAIKFQLFKGEELSSDKQVQKILARFEFDRQWLPTLNKYAKTNKILLCATPFDKAAVNLLSKIRTPFYKIASGDLTNLPLIKEICKKHKPIVLSVGSAELTEVKDALKFIFSVGHRQVSLLHCVASYPAKIEDLNLKVIQTLINEFGLPVGFSDHSMDTLIPSIAVAIGACIIEKHFTLSRKMKGPDHSFALEPDEFKTMVDNIRKIEKSIGSGVKKVLPAERMGYLYGRRGLYTNQAINRGRMIGAEMVAVLRPQTGIRPKDLNKVIGKRAKKDLPAYTPLKWEDLS